MMNRSTRPRPRRLVNARSRRRWMPSVRRPRLPGKGDRHVYRRRETPLSRILQPSRCDKNQNFVTRFFPLSYCHLFSRPDLGRTEPTQFDFIVYPVELYTFFPHAAAITLGGGGGLLYA